jgi:hypothetical protein
VRLQGGKEKRKALATLVDETRGVQHRIVK